MAAKKNDSVLEAEAKVIPDVEKPLPETASFVNVFWDQYELRREHALKNRESREDAYLNAVRELIRFNKKFRHSIGKLYDQSKKTNKEVMSELIHQLSAIKELPPEEAQVEVGSEHDREDLKKHLKEVTGQLERLALTPVLSIVQIIDQLEDRFEKNTETGIEYARERRNAWFEVRKGYVKFARNAHLNLVERSMDSVKAFVKSR